MKSATNIAMISIYFFSSSIWAVTECSGVDTKKQEYSHDDVNEISSTKWTAYSVRSESSWAIEFCTLPDSKGRSNRIIKLDYDSFSIPIKHSTFQSKFYKNPVLVVVWINGKCGMLNIIDPLRQNHLREEVIACVNADEGGIDINDNSGRLIIRGADTTTFDPRRRNKGSRITYWPD